MSLDFCIVCKSNDLPLSDLKGYEGLCSACECAKMVEEIELKWQKELAIYEKRTGQKFKFNEFYYECQKGKIDKSKLTRLPELKSCYEDAIMNIKLQENANKTKQLELNFNGQNDLPF